MYPKRSTQEIVAAITWLLLISIALTRSCFADSASQQACVNALSKDPTQSFCAVETCAYRECIAQHALSIRRGDIVIQGGAPAVIPAACQPHIQVMQNCIREYIATAAAFQRQAEFKSGSYAVVANNYPSTWDLTVAGNSIKGKSRWNCCPSNRVDPLSGTRQGNQVVIERTCTGQGTTQPCHQVYTGTIGANGISGTWTHNGKHGGSWHLKLP